MKDEIFLIVGILLFLTGVLFFVSFVSSRIKCNTELSATVSAVKVSSVRWRGRSINRYTPIFKYSFNGREYSVKGDIAVRDSSLFRVGQTATIFVNPKSPDVFRYGKAISVIVGGIAFLAAGTFLTVCFFL